MFNSDRLEITQYWTEEFYIPLVLRDDPDILAYALYSSLQR